MHTFRILEVGDVVAGVKLSVATHFLLVRASGFQKGWSPAMATIDVGDESPLTSGLVYLAHGTDTGGAVD